MGSSPSALWRWTAPSSPASTALSRRWPPLERSRGRPPGGRSRRRARPGRPARRRPAGGWARARSRRDEPGCRGRRRGTRPRGRPGRPAAPCRPATAPRRGGRPGPAARRRPRRRRWRRTRRPSPAGCACCPAARRSGGPAAARAAGPDDAASRWPPWHRRAARRAVEPTERVARLAPLRHRGEREAVEGDRGQVLGRVDRGVGPAVEHRRLHLLGEHTLAAELGDGHVEAPVALGLDHDQLDLERGVGGAQQVGDVRRLPAGQLGAARRDAQGATRCRRGRAGPRPGARPWGCRPSP